MEIGQSSSIGNSPAAFELRSSFARYPRDFCTGSSNNLESLRMPEVPTSRNDTYDFMSGRLDAQWGDFEKTISPEVRIAFQEP